MPHYLAMTRATLCSLALALLPLLSACGPYGDGAAASRANRRDAERRADDMRVATQQTVRGDDLAEESLTAALSDKTVVSRYASFPSGRAGRYVVYRHYRADGRFVWIDNGANPAGDEASDDYWKVHGARLCVLHRSYSEDETCYCVARMRDGGLQFYIDDPGGQYHELLTVVSHEVLDGPPPPLGDGAAPKPRH